jgi:hypothetical protein
MADHIPNLFGFARSQKDRRPKADQRHFGFLLVLL